MMQALPLFSHLVPTYPSTEGIKYAGSKLKLIPYILQSIKKVDPQTVFDGFSGTTRVSQALAKSDYRVICNDTAVWSEVFGTCYLLNEARKESYQPLIDHLNSVQGIDGWFTEHYGGYPNSGSAVQSNGLKKPWQIHNTRKLDAIRLEIEGLNLSRIERAVALTSLILALDKVDSTLGHFVSYLKTWSPRSYENLVLKVPEVTESSQCHQVYRSDTLDLAPSVQADLAYFDPPYGSNNDKMPPSRVRYAAYYHLWTSVCLFDTPKLFGKANRRKDTSDRISRSPFEDFRRIPRGQFIAVDAIDRLLGSTQAQWILLSYSSGGRATSEELDEVLRRNGKLIDVVQIDYKRNVMGGMTWTNEWVRESIKPHREFLFLLEK